MDNRKYVAYLNTLHNYNAQNPNAYGEKNIGTEYFQETAVDLEISKFIRKQFEETEPHIIVLTGHAGDGKTSLMYQVIKALGGEFSTTEKITDVLISNGVVCRCIKDFSEIKEEDRVKVLKDSLNYPKIGKFVFIVSNTGPLINTIYSLIQQSSTSQEQIEKEKNTLIDAIDKNSGELIDICDSKIEIINIASIDNTDFSVAFIQKMLKDDLWEKCQVCPNCDYCHIYRNVNLIKNNSQRVLEFIKQHYIWLNENGVRLTIRSMTEQLVYMITGGIECEKISDTKRYQENNKDTMLFFNLFFGYLGLNNNDRADSIRAIKEAKKCAYDKKRLRADEILMIDCNFKEVFGREIAILLEESFKKNKYILGWENFLRRAYIFTNIETDEKKKSETMEDIFSKHFEHYIQLREKNITLGSKEKKLVTDALSMMYLGKIEDKFKSEISITLSKSAGVTQNVQLITGTIPLKKINLIQSKTRDSYYHDMTPRYELKLQVDGEMLEPAISLQMLNYFEELRKGIISTNIDPQLSHGVEKLKAQLSEKSQKNENTIEMVVIDNTETPHLELEILSENKINVI